MTGITTQTIGRFPANTILTYDETDFDEVCGGFPNTKGNGNIRHNNNNDKNYNCYSNYGNCDTKGYEDSGSASRYFYCAKASKKDRDEGLDTFIEEKVNDGRQTPIDNAFQRGETLRKNTHPTVKPTELMQYLIRLVTPNGGTVLDPFNGSGSTGKAVMYENKERNKNYKYIGIELTEEYLPIAKARIEHAYKLQKQEEEIKEKGYKQEDSDNQTTIFDFIGE
jgi:site-specific DNA-methyltransferase (adenine-specific)